MVSNRLVFAQVIVTGLSALMASLEEMHTSVVMVPRDVNPVVSAVTGAETDSAVPLHFLFVTVLGVGLPIVVVLPLIHVTVPPVANAVAERGWELLPVFPVHPLAVTVPVTVPDNSLHVMLFSGLVLAQAGPLKVAATTESGMVSAATVKKMRRILPP